LRNGWSISTPKPVPQETAKVRHMWDNILTDSATDERTMTMMYATLTLMAALIAVMFVATAVSSVINVVRENEAARNSVRRSAAH
jgi:hypothetical protein